MSIVEWFQNLFHREKTWRDLDALPDEVLSKQELDGLQHEVIQELKHLQAEAGDSKTAKPQALFYIHKYIDSKFDKNDFDVNTYYSKKQNIIDRNYAAGLGELNSEITGYRELLDEIKEVEQRMRRKINILDTEANLDPTQTGSYDDSAELLKQVQALPTSIQWSTAKE